MKGPAPWRALGLGGRRWTACLPGHWGVGASLAPGQQFLPRAATEGTVAPGAIHLGRPWGALLQGTA